MIQHLAQRQIADFKAGKSGTGAVVVQPRKTHLSRVAPAFPSV